MNAPAPLSTLSNFSTAKPHRCPISLDNAPKSALPCATGRQRNPSDRNRLRHTNVSWWYTAGNDSTRAGRSKPLSNPVSNVQRQTSRRAARGRAQVFRRLARPTRPAHPQRLPHGRRSPPPRSQDEEGDPAKKIPSCVSIGQVVAAWKEGQPEIRRQVAADVITVTGASPAASEITALHLAQVYTKWKQRLSQNTLVCYVSMLRSLARMLEAAAGTEGLSGAIPKIKRSPPRPIVATPEEIQKFLEAAPLGVRLQLLLCLDSAMRFSEAIQVGPHNYDAARGTACVQLKGGRTAEIPVSSRAAAIIAAADQLTRRGESYVLTLCAVAHPESVRMQFNRLKKKLAIRKELHIHDLRRTTATRAYEATKDLRVVQQLLNHESMVSTVRYIAPHDAQKMRPLIEALQIHTRRVQ